MSGDMNINDLARKLQEQADDYKELRYTLYKKIDIKSKKRILDAGCGTGAITADIASLTEGEVIGVDINGEHLDYARRTVADVDVEVTLINADIVHLPFKDNVFDLVVFTVVLTHVSQQQKAVQEMARVTKRDGIVLAAMEPDYAGAIFYPESEVYPLILEQSKERGLDLCTGRKLRFLFNNAGLKTEIGIFTDEIDSMNKDGKELRERYSDHFWYIEKLLLGMGWTEQEIEHYKNKQIELIENNLSFGFLPTFYAIGRKQSGKEFMS